MKYLETKHERNSAKITGLVILIIALLLFVVGTPYKDIPDEYGIAINFGKPSEIVSNQSLENPEQLESQTEKAKEEVTPEQPTEDVLIDEAIEETSEKEIIEQKVAKNAIEEAEKKQAKEESAIEEAAKLEASIQEAAREELARQEVAEQLIAQQEEALRIKVAKEKAEAERLEEKKEKIEDQRIADAKAKKEQETEAERALALKKEAARIAMAKAAKAAKEKAQREAEARAERERSAIANAKREAKERAAKAAAAKQNKSGGSEVVGFALIEEAPIYPGCEGLNNDARKNCMSTKLKQFVANNFDSELASSIGLTGNQKITIYFKISETGQIIDISAKAVDPKLEEEAKRITKLLPRLKPGIQQGKPVIVPYALPVRFKSSK